MSTVTLNLKGARYVLLSSLCYVAPVTISFFRVPQALSNHTIGPLAPILILLTSCIVIAQLAKTLIPENKVVVLVQFVVFVYGSRDLLREMGFWSLSKSTIIQTIITFWTFSFLERFFYEMVKPGPLDIYGDLHTVKSLRNTLYTLHDGIRIIIDDICNFLEAIAYAIQALNASQATRRTATSPPPSYSP